MYLFQRSTTPVLRGHCPACLRCFPARAHLIQMTDHYQLVQESVNDPFIRARCVRHVGPMLGRQMSRCLPVSLTSSKPVAITCGFFFTSLRILWSHLGRAPTSKKSTLGSKRAPFIYNLLNCGLIDP